MRTPLLDIVYKDGDVAVLTNYMDCDVRIRFYFEKEDRIWHGYDTLSPGQKTTRPIPKGSHLMIEKAWDEGTEDTRRMANALGRELDR